MRNLSKLLLLSAALAQNCFADVVCPNSVKCDNNNCYAHVSTFSLYTYEVIGKQPVIIPFVRAYYRPEYAPHVICSYASSHGESQADMGSNERLVANLDIANAWQTSGDIYKCGVDFKTTSPEKCPFKRKND